MFAVCPLQVRHDILDRFGRGGAWVGGVGMVEGREQKAALSPNLTEVKSVSCANRVASMP